MGMSGGVERGSEFEAACWAVAGHERMIGTGYSNLMISSNLFLEQIREGQLA